MSNVSWEDAQHYVSWLSQKTGKLYRLPTEAEWEYAARAGSTTAYYWGESIGSQNANCRDCGSRWGGVQTAPVGSFAPNPWGLFDMAGNVFQWTQDCYHKSYEDAPADGSAWELGCSAGRVARGGAWGSDLHKLRSAYRIWHPPGNRSGSVGFRVARSD